jgi:hypothetical protein
LVATRKTKKQTAKGKWQEVLSIYVAMVFDGCLNFNGPNIKIQITNKFQTPFSNDADKAIEIFKFRTREIVLKFEY